MTNLFCAKRVLCVSALLLGVLTGIPASAAKIEAATAQRLAEKVAAGEPVRLIVKLKGEGVPPTAGRSARSMIKSAIASRQLSLAARHPGLSGTLKRYRHVPFVAVEADALGLTSILNDDEVESIEEDLPLYLNLTQTAAITKSDLAWSSGYRGAGQTIAILDTGVDSAHPFLSGKVVNEACFSAGGANSTSLCPNGADRQTGPGSARPCSDSTLSCYHGTHVAGIAAGKAGVLSNAAGMAPDAKIIAIQVFTRDCEPGGSCSLSAYTSDLGLALDYVYQLRSTYAISSINMSLGGGLYSANCDSQSPSLKTLIDTLRAANIATVVAAGNNGSTDSISLPACISSAISVGATTKSNVVADYSNSSGLVSLLAPGSAIYSSLPGGGYGTASGTSMAAPHVAGIWALMKAAKPTASVSEILAPLQSSGLAITDNRNGIVKPLIQLGGSGGAIASLAGVSNSPPVVSLSSPAAGASFSAPANITVSASASDADGSVAKVEFYHGSALIATDTNASDGWRISWNGVAQGSYGLSAKAFDNAGAAAASASVSITVLNSGAAPTLGLLAHYRFDEASGSTASDASGNNNHASLSNGPSWIAGRVQGALSFDGINDGLSLSRLAGLSNGNTPHTIAAWIRINSLPSNRAWLLLLGDQGEGAHHWLVNSSGISQLGSWSGNQAQPTLPTGVWKHLALTFDGTTLKAYLDGSMIATTGASFNLSGSPLTAASQHIGENFFHGALDELRIYNRALTASEVAALAGP